jgi:hypothetical protein
MPWLILSCVINCWQAFLITSEAIGAGTELQATGCAGNLSAGLKRHILYVTG